MPRIAAYLDVQAIGINDKRMHLDSAAMQLHTFRFPTQIRFGAGARGALAEFAAKHDARQPLLVTDRGLPATEAYRLVAAEMDGVWPGRWQEFSRVQPNPTEQDIEEAFAAFRREGCDSLVGVGGGSGLDAAKAVRLKTAFPQTPLGEIDFDQVPQRLPPMCAIPTTAGTGSEVGRSAVITVAALGRKIVFGADALMPDLAILDPELTRRLPTHLTAATGMDAMTHAIESYVCPMFHPMCDAIALEAIRLVRIYLPRAVLDGNDIEARGNMMIAASMGAVAFQKDLGAAHSLAHPLSSECGVHHGLANAIVLPHVVRFNGEENAAQYQRVTDALGIAPGENPAARVADFLDGFSRSIGISQRLRDLDVAQDRLERLADLAFEDPCHQTNPRICSRDDLLRLYKEAF